MAPASNGLIELLLRSMLDTIKRHDDRITALEQIEQSRRGRGIGSRNSSEHPLDKLLEIIPTLREIFHGILWLLPRAIMGFGFIEGWWASAWRWVLAVIKALP